jgi:biotin synthase
VLSKVTLPTIEQLGYQGSAQNAFHERAASIGIEQFGRRVFIRAVVEVSNFCRENCSYCGMRRDNRQLTRFRAQHEQLAELLINQRPDSVTDVNIQSGEDPVSVREVVLPLIKTIRRETNLGVSVCLGSLDHKLYAELKDAGAGIYIIKYEIAGAPAYAAMNAPGTYDERLANIRHLSATGWRVSSGFIAGLPGQSRQDILANFALADELPLDGCSVSPFIPGDETPLANAPTADIDLTLNCMAALRIMRPDWVIPSVSALNIAEPGNGYCRGLSTGANLVTINLTPSEIRGDYLLYKRDRFIMTEDRILKSIAKVGLTPSSQSLADFYSGQKKVNGSRKSARVQPVSAA